MNTTRIALVLVGLALWSFAGPVAAQHRGSDDPPNVVMIVLDDLNDWVGCLDGHPDVWTPNIDRLASQGILFTNAHTNAPLCNPARASAMIGLRPSTMGVYNNVHDWRGRTRGQPTLIRRMRDAGYRTVLAGKLLHKEFDYVDDWSEEVDAPALPNPPDHKAPPGHTPPSPEIPIRHYDWAPLSEPIETMSNYRRAVAASDYLARYDTSEPLFFAIGFHAPHIPWYLQENYFECFPPDQVNLPPIKPDDLNDVPKYMLRWLNGCAAQEAVVQHGLYRETVAGYLAAIAYADDLVGAVLSGLNQSPIRDNTIVILWSDHGFQLGEKCAWRKDTLWERSTRVPFIIVAPEITAPGSTTHRPVSLVDLTPTILDLCGFPEPADLDGRSLVPLMRNPSRTWDVPAITSMGQNNHSIRTERWRYTRYRNGQQELYDHSVDPYEWNNLAPDPKYRATIDDLQRWLPEVNRPRPELDP